MRWCSCISRKQKLKDSLEEICDSVLELLGQEPDIVFVFVSGYSRSEYETLPSVLKARLKGVVFGCTGHGIIGGDEEIEHSPAISITAGLMSNVILEGSQITADDFDGGPTGNGTRDLDVVCDVAGLPTSIIVLAHPFSFPTERFLLELNGFSSKQIVAGGLAGGGGAAEDVMLFLEDDWYRSGAVLLKIRGNLQVVTAVAQGCRPIGEPMFVTSDSKNSISSLDGKNPLVVLDELYKSLSSTEQALMRSSLFLGLGMRGGESVYEKGDYLIRNIIGSERDTGRITVAAEVRDNEIAQFHVRDAKTSREDLIAGLKRLRNQLGETAELGGLVFSCAGRGAGLYGQVNHDLDVFKDICGSLPLGGFFCNGEIGQVGGNSYLHAYTSSYAIFK